MVTRSKHKRAGECGMLMADLMIAMVILAAVVLPVAFSFSREAEMLRASYCRGVAMEIVDGEMEILAAGEWQEFPEGQSTYVVRSGAVTNLPPGKFLLTRTGTQLRLEWAADEHRGIGPVIREGKGR
jgi:hypothetical protein